MGEFHHRKGKSCVPKDYDLKETEQGDVEQQKTGRGPGETHHDTGCGPWS